MILQVTNAVEFALKHDPILAAIVGLDENQQIRVYDTKAETKQPPPWVIYTMIPSAEGPVGHYGDLRAIETPTFQVTGWGRTKREAGQLFEVAQDALERADMADELLPYTKMILSRVGTPSLFPEEEKQWWQAPALYQLALSR